MLRASRRPLRWSVHVNGGGTTYPLILSPHHARAHNPAAAHADARRARQLCSTSGVRDSVTPPPAGVVVAPAAPFNRLDGLFGVPFLRAPADFTTAGRVCIQVCNTFLAKLEASAAQLGSPTVSREQQHAALQDVAVLVDALSNTLCKVLDAAEACRNNHVSAAWRQAAHETYAELGGYMYQLNSHPPLYNAVLSVAQHADFNTPALSPEQRRLIISMLKEFERGGVHLPPDARELLVALTSEVEALAAEFVQGGTAHTTKFKELHAPTVMRWSGSAEVEKERASCASLGVLPAMNAGAAAYIMEQHASPAVREFMYHILHTSAPESVSLLEALRDKRAELACRLGYASYAEMITEERMAGTPARATAFLQQAAQATLPKAAAEALSIARVAAGSTDTSQPAASAASLPDIMRELAALRLQAGDVARAAATVHEAAAQTVLGCSRAEARAQVGAYLSLHNVVQGLALVVRRAFGVELRAEPVTDAELRAMWDVEPPAASGGSGRAFASWRRSVASAGSAPESRIIRLHLRHEQFGELGTVYLDLLPRNGKNWGAAHFVVQCGKVLSAYDTRLDAALRVPTSSLYTGKEARTARDVQLPIVVLSMCLNTQPIDAAHAPAGVTPSRAGSSAAAVAQDAFMRANAIMPDQLDTIFHEFGHALHSLLSRTETQHLSGTRGQLDFVEVPSHVAEYWARDYRVVSQWAVNSAGEALPQALFDTLIDERRRFHALEMQRQLSQSLFDLALHGADVEQVLHQPGALQLQEYLSGRADSWCAGGASAAAEAALTPVLLPPPAPSGHVPHVRFSSGAAAYTPPAVRPWHHNTSQLLRAVQNGYRFVPFMEGTNWQGQFTHLATYGGGYYSYMYATVFAAQLWQTLFQADPLSPVAGERYRTAILRPGASDSPQVMLRNALGDQALGMRALVSELGIQ